MVIWDRPILLLSDRQQGTLIAVAHRARREAQSVGRARVDGPRRFMAGPACRTLLVGKIDVQLGLLLPIFHD